MKIQKEEVFENERGERKGQEEKEKKKNRMQRIKMDGWKGKQKRGANEDIEWTLEGERLTDCLTKVIRQSSGCCSSLIVI
jgi:hypothetical protein